MRTVVERRREFQWVHVFVGFMLCLVGVIMQQAANNCWSFPTTSDQEHLMAKKGKQLKHSMKQLRMILFNSVHKNTHTHKCSLRQYIMCVSLAVRLRKNLCFQVQRACAGEHPFLLVKLTENKLEAGSPRNKLIDHWSTWHELHLTQRQVTFNCNYIWSLKWH